MRYTYILESIEESGRRYVGCTADLKARMEKHNTGSVPHTAKYKPWRFKTYVAFSDKTQAIGFEQYLKTASDRAFSKKRL